MSPTRKLATATISAIAATFAGAGAPAQAGDFTVAYCFHADGAPVGHLPDVQFSSSARPGTLVAHDCTRPEGGIHLVFDGTEPHAAGEYAQATIEARGAGMGIVGASGAGHYVPGSYDVVVGPLAAFGACGDSQVCNAIRPWAGDWRAATPQEVQDRVAFIIACNQPTCTGGMLSMQRLSVTYRDAGSPTAGPITGTLLESAPGAPIAGEATVRISAADTGAGVRYASVVVDGEPVVESAVQCAPPWDRQHPCPTRLDEQLTVDTRKIAHGTHDLQVTATDAAGNTTVLWSGRLIVDNGAAVGPGADPNLRGAVVGSYAADDATVAAWWPSTKRAPSKNRTVRRRCKRAAYRRRHPVACRDRKASRSLRAGWSAKQSRTIRGRVTTSDGRPVTGARLELVETPTAEGAGSRVVARVRTDGKGAFSIARPLRTGSASYEVRWYPRVRDNQPAASVALRRTVRAATTFRVSATRIRRGRTLTLQGRLRGRTGTLGRTAVAIQANAGNRWRAVTTVRTRSNGRWTARYRIPRQLRGTYRFRARVVPSAGYPYAPGVSRSRPVTVR